jgi:hypothetical protein
MTDFGGDASENSLEAQPALALARQETAGLVRNGVRAAAAAFLQE